MQIIDSNIHLPPKPNLEQELDLTTYDAVASLAGIHHRMQSLGISGGNIMILDREFLRRPDTALLADIKKNDLRLTILIDPAAGDAMDLVDVAREIGANGIKFHPYLQNIYDSQFHRVTSVARYAANQGLWIAVDCSYGTRRVFVQSGVKLAIALADVIQDVPILALHGGGRMVLEVMSLALEADNVIFDLSFSIPYWMGSSIEMDFAFAIRKLGVDRCMYGSDHPYMEMGEALEKIIEYMEKYKFNAVEIDQVIYKTAKQLFAYE
jgi:predicted TIM-barrel fold metal-dependent hydrolase